MNILVTGASRGVGFEIVKQFAKDNSNNIVALSRNLVALQNLKESCENEFNNSIHIYSIDFLSDSFSDDLDNVLEKHRSHFDVIINNAGYLINKPFSETTKLEIESIYKVNVFSPIMILQNTFPFLEGNKRCHVVNIGSMGGVQGSVKFPGLSIYSSSKAALANLSECLAEEYKEKNVYINCLALGSVQTEMLESAFPGYVAQVSAKEMADYVVGFSIQDPIYMNGKTISVSNSTP
jgi:3-oxoacyl-[acyl-carrier protein] reductase